MAPREITRFCTPAFMVTYEWKSRCGKRNGDGDGDGDGRSFFVDVSITGIVVVCLF